MSIGANVRQRRTAAGLTQVELAAMVGVDNTMISQIERGTKALSVPLGVEIAAVLGCTVSDLAEEAASERSQ